MFASNVTRFGRGRYVGVFTFETVRNVAEAPEPARSARIGPGTRAKYTPGAWLAHPFGRFQHEALRSSPPEYATWQMRLLKEVALMKRMVSLLAVLAMMVVLAAPALTQHPPETLGSKHEPTRQIRRAPSRD